MNLLTLRRGGGVHEGQAPLAVPGGDLRCVQIGLEGPRRQPLGVHARAPLSPGLVALDHQRLRGARSVEVGVEPGRVRRGHDVDGVQRPVQDEAVLTRIARRALADAHRLALHRVPRRRDGVEGHEERVEVGHRVEGSRGARDVAALLHLGGSGIGPAPFAEPAHEGEVRLRAAAPAQADPDQRDPGGTDLIGQARRPAQVGLARLLSLLNAGLLGQVGVGRIALGVAEIVLGAVRVAHIQIELPVREPGDGPAARRVVVRQVLAGSVEGVPVVRVVVLEVVAHGLHRGGDAVLGGTGEAGPLAHRMVVGREACHSHVKGDAGAVRESGQTVDEVVRRLDPPLVRVGLTHRARLVDEERHRALPVPGQAGAELPEPRRAVSGWGGGRREGRRREREPQKAGSEAQRHCRHVPIRFRTRYATHAAHILPTMKAIRTAATTITRSARAMLARYRSRSSGPRA